MNILEKYFVLSHKVKHIPPYDPAVPAVREMRTYLRPQENTYVNAHKSPFHSSPKIEITQISQEMLG